MKRILSLTGMVCLICFSQTFAQKNVDPNHVKQLVQKNATALGLSAADVANTRIASAYFDQQSGAVLAYLQQTFQGVDIYNALTTVAFKNDVPGSVSGDRINEVEQLISNKNAAPAITPIAALQNAAADLKLAINQPIVAALRQSADGKLFEYNNLGISANNISVRLLWVPVDENSNLKLAWQVELITPLTNDAWLVKVDAQNGKILNKTNLTVKETFQPVNIRKMDCFSPVQNNKISNVAGVQAINSSKYKVIPYPAESPIHPGGDPTTVTDPWTAFSNSNASSLKWNSDGTTDYRNTRGNNVYAQADLDTNNGTGYSPNSSTLPPDLNFVFTPDFTQDPIEDFFTQSFAITSLFYWNNIMHDMTYQYGFDEPAGNFQVNNQGRGGLGNDVVFADAQEGGGAGTYLNNANFAPAPDGASGRMQMFLWSPSLLKILEINSPSSFAGFKIAVEGNVSNQNRLTQTGLKTNDIVIFKDALHPDSSTGCGASANAAQLAGKIALIDRGSCSFTIKYKNAQTAGAIAVIVANVAPDDPRYTTGRGNTLLTMSGSDNTILIPGVFIGYDSSQRIKGFINGGTAVNATLNPVPKIDGDLDNGVIAHEYTHGISNRLTGGPSTVSCLSGGEQMGEGWSDYFGLMMTTDWATATVNDGTLPRPIGNYASGLTTDYTGIRYYPYSTDFEYDPWTFDSLKTNSDVPENQCLGSLLLGNNALYYIGEIWASTLWDMTWDLSKAYGINTNFGNNTNTEAGGNTIAMNLVMQGMKLQKCNPGCVDGRDAILKADTLLYGGKYSPIIWKAFARRGLGVGASQGSSCKAKDVTGSYAVPAALPVTFGSFTAEKINTTAVLRWTTVTESNAERFAIERSNDGRTYTEVGSVKAAGNSNTLKSYQYTDIKPVKGNNMYRIKQIDRDGKYNYSDLRTLSFDDLKKLIAIAPNPAKDRVVLTVAGNTKTVQVRILNSIGQQVASYTLTGESMPMDVSKLSKGVYYVSVTGEGINTKEKLVIQ